MMTPYPAFKTLTLLVMILSLTWMSPAFALDIFLKNEISTKLTPEPEISQVNIVRLPEKIQPVATSITYEEVLNVEIILDASRTMSELDLQGRMKLEVAKDLVITLIENLPKHTRFALRVNGGQYENNCLDSVLLVSFEKGNAAKILEKIKEIQPKGLTPLFYSIRESVKDLENLSGGKVVFVLSDGQETCDIGFTDSCAVTFDRVDEARTGQIVNVIGINPISPTAIQGLECIAVRGRGNFLNTNIHTREDLIQLAQKTGRLRYSIYQVLEDLTDVKLLDAAIGDSPHILKPGIYRLEISTIPPLSTYFTLDRLHNFTIGIVNSNGGLDTYERAHLALGNWHVENNRIQEALAEYSKVLKMDPRNTDAYLNIAILMDDALQDKAKAVELYRTYLELGGPRQEEVKQWVREALEAIQAITPRPPRPPEPSRQEVIEQLTRRATERAGITPEEQKVLDLRTAILSTYTQIVSFRNEDLDKADVIGINVLPQVADAEAADLAVQIGNRIQQELNRTPGIVMFRDNVQVAEARFDEAGNTYTVTPTKAPE